MIKDDVYDKINNQLVNISKGEVRAANLEVFPRLVGALHDHSGSCTQCRDLYEKSNEYVEDIIVVLRGAKEKRKDFENVVNEALTHLQQKHKAIPKGRILSVSVTTGMLSGLAVAVLAGYFINGDLMGYGALGWLIGVTAGWITGKVKEHNLKKGKRLF
jgi:hypothetical protein